MLKAVGFDLWETLITDTPELSRQQERLRLTRMEEILTARGYDALGTRIERAYRDLWQRCHELYWSEDRDIECRRQIEHFLEALELDPATFAGDALEELEKAYAMAAVEILPSVIPGAIDVLRELKSRGLRLGLISNTGRTPGYALREVLKRLGIAEYLEVMVFSNEHGVCKPQKSIFEELRGCLRVHYTEMAFVGDNLYVDVLGAQRLGMRAIHFDPPVRGTAVALPVEHEEVTADAVVSRLDQVPAALSLTVNR